MECVLTKSAESVSNPPINTPQYLTKDVLPRTILVIHLEMDISEKFNLNLGYILTGASDSDNQDDALYKAYFIKLMDTLRSDNFVTTESGDKWWGLVPGGSASGWWRIRSDTSLKLCLNEQRDLVNIGLFLFVVNNGMFTPWESTHWLTTVRTKFQRRYETTSPNGSNYLNWMPNRTRSKRYI